MLTLPSIGFSMILDGNVPHFIDNDRFGLSETMNSVYSLSWAYLLPTTTNR